LIPDSADNASQLAGYFSNIILKKGDICTRFFAGIFLVNILPHFIHGITGKSFPAPFADPLGKGLSSPTLNVLWATINFLIGFISCIS